MYRMVNFSLLILISNFTLKKIMHIVDYCVIMLSGVQLSKGQLHAYKTYCHPGCHLNSWMLCTMHIMIACCQCGHLCLCSFCTFFVSCINIELKIKAYYYKQISKLRLMQAMWIPEIFLKGKLHLILFTLKAVCRWPNNPNSITVTKLWLRHLQLDVCFSGRKKVLKLMEIASATMLVSLWQLQPVIGELFLVFAACCRRGEAAKEHQYSTCKEVVYYDLSAGEFPSVW